MAEIDVITLALAKKFTRESLLGGGAVVGKNVTISSIEPIDGGNRVTFSYTLDNGVTKEDYLDVMNGKNGNPGEPGENGVSITGIEKIGTDGLVDTYQISFSDGSTFDYEVKNGAQGLQGLRGDQGQPGVPGQTGIQGIPGEKGDDGYPFLIYKEYASLEDFNADDFPEIGLMFMVKEKDENDSFPVYRYTGEGENPYSYITGLSNGEAIKGEQGIPGKDGEQGVPGQDGKDGTTYQPTIGTVTAGDTASASVETDEDNKTAKFNFVLPKGDKGDSGNTYTPIVGTVTDSEEPTVEITINEDKKEAKFNFGLVKGDKGDTPYIGDNGNWWYGDEDSGVPIPSFLDLLKYVDRKYGIQDTPIGHILTHMGTSVPNHYLVCDGTEYQIADYPFLTQHFIDNFGSVNFFGGDGETTFAVPDLRGEFLRGSGVNSHSGQGNGGEVGDHQDGTVHTNIFAANTKYLYSYKKTSTQNNSAENVDSTISTATKQTQVAGSDTNKSGGIVNFTSRPTNTSVLYCIKYEPTYFLQINNYG